MLGASGVQIPENNLDNLKLTREEDGEFDIVDPQCLLGFEMLEGLDLKILGSLLKSTDFATLVFLWYILISGLGLVIDFEVVSLRGYTLVAVILVKGHIFPAIVKVCPVDLDLERCDLLALVELIIPVEGNTGLLEFCVLWESTCFCVLLDDVAGSANLTFLFLFNGVT
ncbi:hypothetical protein Tco_0719002 [Tanacetum coccineum]